MKPRWTFIFFLAVAALIFLIALIFPRQGVYLSDDIQLKFMQVSELGTSDSSYTDALVEQLMAQSTVSEDPEADFDPLVLPRKELSGDAMPAEPDSREEVPPGKIKAREEKREKVRVTAAPPPVAPANVDSLKQALRPIEFRDDHRDALDPFFDRLEGLRSGSLSRTRILHFGDSQIENDRMTSLIRYRLQKQFGGSGCGLTQARPLYSGHLAFRQEREGDWMRYTYFGKRDTSIRHNAFGIMGAFTSVPAPEENRWPRIQYSYNTSRRTGTFDRIAIFMHSYAEQAALAMKINNSLADTLHQIPAGFSMAEYRHYAGIEKLELGLNMPEGGRIYGISFESHEGLLMDNIAMRGGSGLIFSKMNRDLQLSILDYLSPGLIILQYGGNVVPYINPARYRESFTREIVFLREICPDTPIIVIGPADMSHKVRGRYVSYTGVEPVRDALRRAALDNGCAFWDLYEAMGGHNSMPSFVQAKPPLASRDYVHFSSLGVNLVAEMFYNALMQEYQTYLEVRN
jgi:hypothetical protein